MRAVAWFVGLLTLVALVPPPASAIEVQWSGLEIWTDPGVVRMGEPFVPYFVVKEPDASLRGRPITFYVDDELRDAATLDGVGPARWEVRFSPVTFHDEDRYHTLEVRFGNEGVVTRGVRANDPTMVSDPNRIDRFEPAETWLTAPRAVAPGESIFVTLDVNAYTEWVSAPTATLALDGVDISTVQLPADGKGFSVTFPAFRVDRPGEYVVSVRCEGFEGVLRQTISASEPFPPPPAVAWGLHAEPPAWRATQTDVVTLWWNASSPLASFTLEERRGSGPWTPVGSHRPPPEEGLRLKGYAPGEVVRFRLVGPDGEAQRSVRVEMPRAPEGGFHVRLEGRHIEWDPLLFDGGLAVRSYRIYEARANGDRVLVGEVSAGGALAFDLPHPSGKFALFEVRAVNAAGEGASSLPVEVQGDARSVPMLLAGVVVLAALAGLGIGLQAWMWWRRQKGG